MRTGTRFSSRGASVRFPFGESLLRTEFRISSALSTNFRGVPSTVDASHRPLPESGLPPHTMRAVRFEPEFPLAPTGPTLYTDVGFQRTISHWRRATGEGGRYCC